MKSFIIRLFAFTNAFIFFIAACAMSAVPVANAQVSGKEGRATLTLSENGKLSLKAQGVKLKTLLAQIQAKTKVQYNLSDRHIDVPISLNFQSLSLHDAIKRILHGISHACILDAQGRIERIMTFAEVASPAQLAFKPDDASKPQETGMDSKSIEAVRMPPPEVVQMLKEEAAPAPPPGAVQDKE